MPTIRALADAYLAAGADNSSGLISRMSYWVDVLGDMEAGAVTGCGRQVVQKRFGHGRGERSGSLPE